MDDTYKKALGERLRAARIAARKTQQEVANLIGMTKATVSHWERGTWAPEMASLVAVAEALNVEPSEILGDHVLQELTGDTPTRKRLAATSSIVPLFGWEVALGVLKNDYEAMPDKFIATLTKHGSKAIAIVIEDRACAPKFIPGDVVTIDPDVEPSPGQYVLAEAQQRLAFRRWAPGKKAGRLISTNEFFPEMVAERIYGTMGEHISTSHD